PADPGRRQHLTLPCGLELGLGDLQSRPVAVSLRFDLCVEGLFGGAPVGLEPASIVLGGQLGLELGAGLNRAGFGAARRATLSLAEQAHSRPPPGNLAGSRCLSLAYARSESQP